MSTKSKKGEQSEKRTGQEDSDSEYSDPDDYSTGREPDPEVEVCEEGIRKILKDLNEIRARCNGVVNRDIKAVMLQLKDKMEELVELAVARGNSTRNFRKDIRELEEDVERLRRQKRESEQEKQERKDMHQEILVELKALREEVKATRETKDGKDKGMKQDRGTGKVNTGRTYADTTGKTVVTENMGKRDNGRSQGIRENKETKDRAAPRVSGNRKAEERTEIVRVKSKDDFPTLVRKIRKGTNVSQSEVSVLAVKKSEQGNMMLKVQGKMDSRNRFREELEKCVGEKCKVTRLQRKEYVHLANLDAVTTPEEIEASFSEETGLTREDVIITSLRSAFGESQKATVKIPKEAAEALNRTGKIKIGMVVSRVSIRTFEIRCFKCGVTGHIAAKCTDT